MRVQRLGGRSACTYCGARGGAGGMVVAVVRGVGYDYCDAACATAHQQAIELAGALCPGCDEPAVGDTGVCDEHLAEPGALVPAGSWRQAG